MEYLAQHIEGLIFTAPKPISIKEIQECLEETFEAPFPDADIKSAINSIKERYQESDFSFEIVAVSGGFQFMTKGAYHQTIGTLLKQTTKKKLSRAALETLSIVAYKQPVIKSEIEKIRGVSCDYAIQKLLEKELVDINGRSEGPGRPLLYGTSEKFMDYFGLESLKELPKPKDFRLPDNVVGEAAPIEESMLVEVDEGYQGIQIGNINLAPVVVLDMKGGELVVGQLDPIMENAIEVIATGVGLFDEKDLSPTIVPPKPASQRMEVADAEAISDTISDPLIDDIVETCISVAVIFDKEAATPKVVLPLPENAIFSVAKNEEE